MNWDFSAVENLLLPGPGLFRAEHLSFAAYHSIRAVILYPFGRLPESLKGPNSKRWQTRLVAHVKGITVRTFACVAEKSLPSPYLNLKAPVPARTDPCCAPPW